MRTFLYIAVALLLFGFSAVALADGDGGADYAPSCSSDLSVVCGE